MKRVLTVLLAVCFLLALVSCGGSDARSFVRIVNASPDAGAIDVTINGTKMVSAEAYGSGSNYFTETPGTTIDLTITAPGANGGQAVNFQTKIGLVDKVYYTIAAVGLAGEPSHLPSPIPSTFTILQATDDHTAPATGDVKIRVLQLDPTFHIDPTDNGPVDAYITTFGAPLNGTSPDFADLTFQSPSAFVSKTVPADGNLEIRAAPFNDSDPNNDNLMGWDSQKVLFAAGQVRTYVLLNNPAGTPFPNQSVMLSDLN